METLFLLNKRYKYFLEHKKCKILNTISARERLYHSRIIISINSVFRQLFTYLFFVI